MRSAALVSVDGTVDFFCFPEFDSPTIFASLLDSERAGAFRLRPAEEGYTLKQLYLPGTNVLLTRFLSEDSVAEITDFMPIGREGSYHGIMRRVVVLEGEVDFLLQCAPAFDYARSKHTAEKRDGAVLFTPENDACHAMLLRSSVDLKAEDGCAKAAFRLKKGEDASFLLAGGEEENPSESTRDLVKRHLDLACAYWVEWSRKSVYHGRWREMVTRSALALKLLTSDEHGSMIAAATFGLPETPGGERNWDYRYVWLRDASFTAYAFARLGHVDETKRFMEWLKDRLVLDGDAGPLRVMYRVDGSPVAEEAELAHFNGYRDSRPVRVGNGARGQLQLDIYGELFDAAYLASKYGDGVSYGAWKQMEAILAWLSDHWRDPDEGIWEVRGGRKEFLHSRLMCWVAFDRFIRLGSKRSMPGPFERMEADRDAIAKDIQENFWDEEIGAFVQYKGAKIVDASALLMPLLRFISPTDPRWLSTMAVIERDLTVDTFVMRYKTGSGVDGLTGREGSFTACSFWLVEALARSHQLEKAHLLMEKLMSHANPLGLYSEELSASGVQLGNFPQALTHLALISAATYLDRRLETHQPESWA